MKINCYIDGFNLYYAIKELRKPHLKWVNLRKLASQFVGHDQTLGDVFYFSAFMKDRPNVYKRHKAYVRALESVGVMCEMSEFFKKPRLCINCGHTYTAHEEKQSDVKLALWMYDHASKGDFDKALLITGDSDLTPAIRLIKEMPSKKRVTVITPPGRAPSGHLVQAAGKKALKFILPEHIEDSLFPAKIATTIKGKTVTITRPTEYNPPKPATLQSVKKHLSSK